MGGGDGKNGESTIKLLFLLHVSPLVPFFPSLATLGLLLLSLFSSLLSSKMSSHDNAWTGKQVSSTTFAFIIYSFLGRRAWKQKCILPFLLACVHPSQVPSGGRLSLPPSPTFLRGEDGCTQATFLYALADLRCERNLHLISIVSRSPVA